MAQLSAQDLVHMARQAGYHVAAVEHLRPNRWLLTLTDATGATIALLVQARPLVSSADVQDLAEIVQVRSFTRGILLAYGGNFSGHALRTCTELDDRLRLCTTLPLAAAP
jgi:hypothetical protein